MEGLKQQVSAQWTKTEKAIFQKINLVVKCMGGGVVFIFEQRLIEQAVILNDESQNEKPAKLC